MAKITNDIGDTFRPRSIGHGKTMPFNSKPATDNFHVDRSQLGEHEEWDDNAPNEWGGRGKTVPVKNSIMDNVRGAMGGIAAKSSSKCHESNECPANGCVAPYAYEPRPRGNPLMRRKGD